MSTKVSHLLILVAKTFEQIAEFLSIIVKSVTESYVFRLFSVVAQKSPTRTLGLSEDFNIATLVGSNVPRKWFH